MREYRVPLSTKEEEKLVFNLSARQCLWFGLGIIFSIILIGMPALVFGLPLPKVIYLLPLGLPPLGISTYMAKKRVKELDMEVNVDAFLWRKFKYNHRVHNYYLFRK